MSDSKKEGERAQNHNGYTGKECDKEDGRARERELTIICIRHSFNGNLAFLRRLFGAQMECEGDLRE